LIYSGFFVSERERHRLRGENPLFELIHRLSTGYPQLIHRHQTTV